MSPSEPNVDAARLLARGQPLHTRSLVVDVFREDAMTLRTEAQILDLRKCGFVPGAGDLQTAGVIHQMTITGWLDYADRVLQRLEVEQPTVAYEPDGETTGGECCRDPAPRLQALVGTRFDDGFAPRMREISAGPLGCSHLLTLGQLMAATLPPGLLHDKEIAPKGLSERRDGERLFKRTLTLDGLAAAEDRMELTAQMTDFQMLPRQRVTKPFERLARQHEVHVHARIDLSAMTLVALDAAERIRSWATFAAEDWTSASERVAPLVGGPALRGLSREVFRQIGDEPEQAPLRDVLLNLGPCLIQCLAATSARWMIRLAQQLDPDEPPAPTPANEDGPDREMMGGLPDSCYLWRSNGVMTARRTRSVPVNEDGD